MTPEACQLVVRYASSRADLCSLCAVSKTFRTAAERALYNTLFLVGSNSTTQSLCHTLITQLRLAHLVGAITIHIPPTGGSTDSTDELPATTVTNDFWANVSRALHNATFLRHLNIHINDDSDTAMAWIFQRCTFKLFTFHCDLQWDAHLISFLNRQDTITDLYILNYTANPSDSSSSADHAETSLVPSAIAEATQVQKGVMPCLALLECTSIEAAAFMIPGRAITRLKTSISQPNLTGKLAEISTLFENVPLAKRRLRSLYVADDFHSWTSSQAILTHAMSALPVLHRLRYIGVLVLPIGGQERLMLYGVLRKLPKLQCLELDITAWDPPPATLRAYRALSKELALYCKIVDCIVFVQDDDRTVMIQEHHRAVPYWDVDADMNTDTLWRDV